MGKKKWVWIFLAGLLVFGALLLSGCEFAKEFASYNRTVDDWINTGFTAGIVGLTIYLWATSEK
ncbi:MAG TPA: hypothetical protein P5560_07985 [Thermotogota bacterium]|nr:hypothetical protein [Thermotogota bacterium]HRW92865.1 hypothetical protein [Thermotogota bacterium]